LGTLKGPVAPPQQDTHRPVWTLAVGHREVGYAIAVEVAHHYGLGIDADSDGPFVLEATIALAQQDNDCSTNVARIPYDGEVGDAVAIKVPDRHGNGNAAARVVTRGHDKTSEGGRHAKTEQRGKNQYTTNLSPERIHERHGRNSCWARVDTVNGAVNRRPHCELRPEALQVNSGVFSAHCPWLAPHVICPNPQH